MLCFLSVLPLRHSSDVNIFHAATGHAGLSSNGSGGVLFRAEELFSALHHSGESQVTSLSIYFTSLTRKQLQVFSSGLGGRGGVDSAIKCFMGTPLIKFYFPQRNANVRKRTWAARNSSVPQSTTTVRFRSLDHQIQSLIQILIYSERLVLKACKLADDLD